MAWVYSNVLAGSLSSEGLNLTTKQPGAPIQATEARGHSPGGLWLSLVNFEKSRIVREITGNRVAKLLQYSCKTPDSLMC